MLNQNLRVTSLIVAVLFPCTIFIPSKHSSTAAFLCSRDTPSFHGSRTNTRLQSISNENIPPLTRFLDNLSNTNLFANEKSIKLKELVIAKYDLPKLGIYGDQMYELQSVYLQGRSSASSGVGSNPSGKIIEKVPLPLLDLENRKVPPGFTLYITLYSPMYHDNENHGGRGVIVTPGEVGLIRMKDEIADSILVALPVLSLWVGLSMTFANIYHQRYGGNLLDAFLGR